MPPLVGQGRDRLVVVVVVHQNVRMDVVDVAVHVGPRLLSLPGMHIHPAGREALGDRLPGLLAEWNHRVQHQLLAPLDGEIHLARDQGWIDIPVAHVGHTHHPRSQPEVPVKHVQVLVRLLDEGLVDGCRNPVGIERCLERAAVLADPGVEDVALDLCVQHCPEGPAKATPYVEERAKYVLPVSAVRCAAVTRISCLVQKELRPVG